MSFRPVLALCATATLLATAPALAAQRYAAPTPLGAMNCSTAADACSFPSALAASTTSGDEVILAGGTYPAITTPINQVASTISVHAADPAARPLLQFTTNGQLRLFAATLRDVDFSATANNGVGPLYDSGGGTIERVRITSSGPTATGAELYSTTMRDSTIVVSGTNARGIWTSPSGSVVSSQLRNLTVLASGTNSHALDLGNNFSGGSTTVIVSNVIARGSTTDVFAHAVAGAPVSIQVDHSSFATASAVGGAVISDGGGNQNATAPVFVDQAGGDLREAPGSPTIDAGADAAANGTLDVTGGQRQVATTDIGAFEFLPAPVVGAATAAATGQTTATVSAPVTPGGVATTIRADFGATTAYGTSTAPQDAGSAVTSATQALALTGLAPATTYHAQLVAVSAGGTATTSDVTFTTDAAPVSVPDPPAGGPGAGGTPVPPTLRPIAATLITRSARIGGRRMVTLTLSCPVSAAAGCGGSLLLSSGNVRQSKRYTQAAGTRLELAVRISAKLLARIRSAKTHRRTITARTATGAAKRKLTLRAP
jgi:hypothetical protein